MKLIRFKSDLIPAGIAAVLLFAAYAVVVGASAGKGPAPMHATQAMLGTIQNAIRCYQQDNAALPASLAALQAGGPMSYLDSDKPIRDAWGREFVYTPAATAGHDYQLCSKGPDGRYPSADDIDVWKVQIGQ